MKSNNQGATQRQHPKAIHKALLSVLSLAAGLLLADPALAANKSAKISKVPYTITEPGTYTVTQDLGCSGTAITIVAVSEEHGRAEHPRDSDRAGLYRQHP
jgi:hypothetical protein